MRLRTPLALALVTGLALAACGSDDPSTDGTDGAGTSDDSSDAATDTTDTTDTTDAGGAEPTTPESTEGGSEVVAGEAFPDDRCAANEAAGTITYLTGFDFAATASIVDVIVADANGYYDAMCLDVEIQPSVSTANDPLVAENDAQFASG